MRLFLHPFPPTPALRYLCLYVRFPQIKGVENSSQQLAISFERNNAHSSGIGAPDQGGGVGHASPSLGFAYRRTPRSNAFIQPRGLGGGGVAAAGTNGGGHGNNGNMAPPPSSSRLLSEGTLTPSGKSGVLSPDVYLSGGVKRLNIPPDTEERRQRFSAARPLIKVPETPPVAGISGGGSRRPVAEDDDLGTGVGRGGGGGARGSTSNGNGVEVKGEGTAAAAAVFPTPENNNNGGPSAAHGNKAGILSSPDGSARRDAHGGGLVSPPPSTGVGTDVRAAAGGGDESLLDASPAESAGRLFAEGHGDKVSSKAVPKLDAEGYETVPLMSELVAMEEDALRSVSGFVVRRPGFGSIAWKEAVDLRGVDIGQVVSVRG